MTSTCDCLESSDLELAREDIGARAKVTPRLSARLIRLAEHQAASTGSSDARTAISSGSPDEIDALEEATADLRAFANVARTSWSIVEEQVRR